MGALYYSDAAGWLRAIGLHVVETDGWETRARSSGGFAAPPLGIQWHHTASSASPESDVAWMTDGSDDAPIGNILIARDGAVWMIAAGAANTAGKGGPLELSRGTVPLDSGNSTTWALEVANNGVGEVWPDVQVDAYFAVSNELNRRFGNAPTDVFTHALGDGDGWTDRKIDPATAAAVDGAWHPSSASSSGTWRLSDIRAECARRAGTLPPPQPGPTPPPTPGPPGPPIREDELSMIVALDGNGTAWIGDGMDRYAPTEDDFNVKVLLAGDDALRLVNTQGERVNGWGSVYTVGDNVIEALGRPR
jgi:hypothetical protein